MAFERNHTPEVVQALDAAHAIARRMGGVDYLKAKARTVSDILLSREHVPAQLSVKEGAALQPYRITRTYPREWVRRTVKVADLKRVYPSAYKAAVTVSKPEQPYQLRLECEFGGRPSKEWAEEKTVGQENWTAVLAQRYGVLEWDRVDIQSRVLFELRRDIRDQEKRIAAERAALAGFITDHELPLRLRGFGDGRLVLRENPLRQQVDYDLLERQFPAAASLIRRTTMPGTPLITFRKILPDPEEGGEESAEGIWKA